MILGIDTSIGTAVAVVEPDGVIRSEAHSEDPRGHAEVIGILLEKALAEASVTPADITRVAVGMGPGPFTGLRVGIAAARTFAQARGIPAVPVVSHDAIALGLALEAAVRGAEPHPVLVVTDARRREFAVTPYDGIDEDGLPVRRAEPTLHPRDAVEAGAFDRVDAGAVPAAMVALVAARALAAGRVVGPDEALYLRAPDVTPPRGVA